MKSETSTYTGFEFEVDGYPALAIINADLKKMDNRLDYPYSVFISIIPDAVNENGHPLDEEYEYLNEVEKKIIAYLEEQTESVHVGHTTVFRGREIIFYTNDKELVEIFLENFLVTIEREFTFDVEPDPEWENVEGFYELI
ncbi:MAG: DUF695 domain-containing protein [Flavisolibacter sp.]|jgi:hypothetical protein